jgi:uncharacterized protein with NAD-binding domain and iron-sulfur cluster
MRTRKRIAILGGGMAALVTAYELSKLRDNGEPRYDITVYQQGWRLGGKGASGRNATQGDRIEEHGLHVLFGCYENTFRILREIYGAQLGAAIGKINDERQTKKQRPIAVLSYDEAFHGHSQIATYEPLEGGWSQHPWMIGFPVRDGEPGDGRGTHMSASSVIRLLLAWVRRFVGDWRAAGEGEPLEPPRELEALLSWIEDWLQRHDPDTDRTAPREYVRVAEHLQDQAERHPSLTKWLTGWAAPASLDLMHRFANAMAGLAGRAAHVLHRHPLEDHLRQGQLVIDFSLAVLAGILRDRVIGEQQNWFSIDNWDFRAWLAHHGARRETLASAFCNGLYMACFSSKHELGAGTILQALFRVAHYKGHLFYRMQGGMGDIIFAPLYLVLRQQGVKFRFFMRVKAIHATGDRIDRVVIENQAPHSPPDYEPLVVVRANNKYLLCWPHQPIADRLDRRDAQVLQEIDAEDWWQDIPSAQTLTLTARSAEATTDAGDNEFDTLVLGISVGALSDICAPLLAGNPRFAAMLNSVVTTPTQAAQLWLKDPRAKLGWVYLASPNEQPMVIPFEGEFDTCADMSHLLRWENVANAETLVYVCSSLRETYAAPPPPHPGYVQGLRDQVLQNLRDWLAGPAAKLWPQGGNAGTLDDPCFVPARLLDQHYIAVLNPSDRYVLAVPGSNARRLRADESGYQNMYLAGDWTKTAMSIGCLEAATMSGIQAGRSIDGAVPRAHFDWLP